MTDTLTAIVRAGLDLWRNGAESDVTLRAVGQAVGITHPGVRYHTGSTAGLRAAVAAAAVATGDAVVIRKLIVGGHPAVSAMDQATRLVWLAGA